jgi:hypothetical protein
MVGRVVVGCGRGAVLVLLFGCECANGCVGVA